LTFADLMATDPHFRVACAMLTIGTLFGSKEGATNYDALVKTGITDLGRGGRSWLDTVWGTPGLLQEPPTGPTE